MDSVRTESGALNANAGMGRRAYMDVHGYARGDAHGHDGGRDRDHRRESGRGRDCDPCHLQLTLSSLKPVLKHQHTQQSNIQTSKKKLHKTPTRENS